MIEHTNAYAHTHIYVYVVNLGNFSFGLPLGEAERVIEKVDKSTGNTNVKHIDRTHSHTRMHLAPQSEIRRLLLLSSAVLARKEKRTPENKAGISYN